MVTFQGCTVYPFLTFRRGASDRMFEGLIHQIIIQNVITILIFSECRKLHEYVSCVLFPTTQNTKCISTSQFLLFDTAPRPPQYHSITEPVASRHLNKTWSIAIPLHCVKTSAQLRATIDFCSLILNPGSLSSEDFLIWACLIEKGSWFLQPSGPEQITVQ